MGLNCPRLVALPIANGVFLIVTLFSLLTISAAADPPLKPNIVLLLTDDMGWGDSLAYNPNSKIVMPNLERLAAEGMRFTDAHTSAAMCAPTRYSILTGNYHWRGRLPWGQWSYFGQSQITDGQRTLADILKGGGYNTAMFGKLHMGGLFYIKNSDEFVPWNGLEEQIDFARRFLDGPLDHGFNYSYLALSGIQGPPYAFFENDQLVGDPADLFVWTKGTYGSSRVNYDGIGMPYWDSSQVGPTLTEKAIAFIDRHHQANLAQGSSTPFFLYYSSQAAHGPFTPPATFLGEPVQGVTGMTKHTDMIYEIDVALGKLIEALEQRGLVNDTLIIVTSDNGGLPYETLLGHDAVGGLRGEKGTIWEGGHRVPLIAKWGNGTSSGSVIPPNAIRNQLIGVHDLMATLAALVHERLPYEQARDSFNFLPVLLGEINDDTPVRDHIIMEAPVNLSEPQPPRQFGFRKGQWKLVFDENMSALSLYNLTDDLAETNDLISQPEQAERVARMETEFQQRFASGRTAPLLLAPTIKGKPPYLPGVDGGVYVWKEAIDDPYHLRVSGDGTSSIFEVSIVAGKPFQSVVLQQQEADDSLVWANNNLSFISRESSGQDGIDFVLPPGTPALMTVSRDGQLMSDRVYVGGFADQLISSGWITNVNDLPASPPFEPGKTLGFFIGGSASPDIVSTRWNGDGINHAFDFRLLLSDPVIDVVPLSFESCCDFLTADNYSISVKARSGTWWDGVDLQISPQSQLGLSYRQDGLVYPYYVNPTTGGLGVPNAYELPFATFLGKPVYDASRDRGLFIWKDAGGTWHLRGTAAGAFTRYTGTITGSEPASSVQAVQLELNYGDVLEVVSEGRQIDFNLQMINQWVDGIDFTYPEGATVTLQIQQDTAAGLIKGGAENWPVTALPVTLQ